MTSSKLIQLGEESGFTAEQMRLLMEHFSLKPHTHTADQITDFDEAVTEIVEDTGVTEDEDEEGEFPS